ncbi:hypothetical protein CBP51_03270 [Cellvibrio mixtus]|uniref:Uncharacterized protein n=1 Tax=Cellvibrio mixtus TaxID=39650 RepID=A0A266Q8X3_9GAMM|nr:hypothetical protein [Cellvibrio mixtus]OZY86066.1 hypothetical protein CBP51_03270 [Cellvibrio mixtus]
MPIVFVHGVNNRIESADYLPSVERKSVFLKTILSPRIGINKKNNFIDFPYWGDSGVKFRWNQASLPSSGEDEELAMGIPDNRERNIQFWLNEFNFQYGGKGINLGALSKSRGFETAVDLMWDVVSVVLDTTSDEVLIDYYNASMQYVAKSPVPTWAFQSPPLSNEKFIEILFNEIEPYKSAKRADAASEVLGFGSALQSIREIVNRIANAPGDAISALGIKLARESAHSVASQFIGDVFTYLNERGRLGNEGAIVKKIVKSLRDANDRKQSGDDKLVVIGHSLGGVILYDILTHFAQDVTVDIFITVGSQVALFEEMSLYRKPVDDPRPNRLERPQNIKKWLNVYDTNDIFSFRMSGVFDGVDDYRFDTGYGILASHGGYFERPSFYKRLAARLKEE